MVNVTESNIYEFDSFRVDAGKRLLWNGGGEPIPLKPKVFDTLLYLVSHPAKVIEKDELMSAIWPDTIVEENNLNKNISVLRRVLGENPHEHRFIVTVPGKGYKFVADVRTVANERLPEPSHYGPADEGRAPKQPAFRFVLAGATIGILIVGAMMGSYFWGGPNVKTSQSIAVLPFKPLVAKDRDEALELGMADALIGRLGSDSGLTVRPLSSVRKYGDLDADAVSAGRDLGVESILEGSIQRVDSKIRINARLIEVPGGIVLWTATYDEQFTNIFEVQDSIAKKVTAALLTQLGSYDRTDHEKRPTNSPEAWEHYSRARYHSFRITPEEIRNAIGFYEKAIAVDPGYAPAYSGLADAYRTQCIAAHDRYDVVCPKAKVLANRALEIDETLAEAHVVLGWIGFLYDSEWENAEKHLKRAVELAPESFEAHRGYGHLLSNSGRHEEALVEIRRARELAPLALINLTLEGQFLLYARRLDEAMERIDSAIELDPNFWHAYLIRAQILTQQGRYEEAISAGRRARELSGAGHHPIQQLGYAYARSGRHKEARAMLAELESIARKEFVPGPYFAVIYNGLGETDKALEVLERSDPRQPAMAFLKVDARLDNLRSEPRLIKVIDQINFPRNTE